MPRILQSSRASSHESTGRTIRSPFLFPSLPSEIQTELRANATLRMFDDGQLVQQRGDESDGFWLIESGQVKMGRYNPDGDMRVFAILGAKDCFGEQSCIGGFPRVADAVAVGPTQILWISIASFFSALDKSPGTERAMLRLLACQLQEALDIILVVRKMPAQKQLARALTTLCGSRPPPVTLTIRHDELAELVGVSRVTIGTLLTRLERDGLLTRGYRLLVIPEPKALGKFARS